MSSKCSVFIATSLDGFIARKDGSIDWLLKANNLAKPGEDCGYKAFMATVDCLVMGRHSFESVLTFAEWPYENIPVVVLSSKPVEIPQHLKANVSASSENPPVLVRTLAAQGLNHLYIDGGITIQKFLEHGLIHELIITIIPVLLGNGRSLFGPLQQDISLKHIKTQSFDGGFVQIKYEIPRALKND